MYTISDIKVVNKTVLLLLPMTAYPSDCASRASGPKFDFRPMYFRGVPFWVDMYL